MYSDYMSLHIMYCTYVFYICTAHMHCTYISTVAMYTCIHVSMHGTYVHTYTRTWLHVLIVCVTSYQQTDLHQTLQGVPQHSHSVINPGVGPKHLCVVDRLEVVYIQYTHIEYHTYSTYCTHTHCDYVHIESILQGILIQKSTYIHRAQSALQCLEILENS